MTVKSGDAIHLKGMSGKAWPALFVLVLITSITGACSMPAKYVKADEFEIIFLGDTSFGENYQDRRHSQGRGNILLEKGYDYLLQNFSEVLSREALIVANLETPITSELHSPLAYKRQYVHYADIEKTPRYLSDYNFDLVSLGNNHAMDYGPNGLNETIERLSAHGIDTCGAGKNAEAAGRPWKQTLELEGQEVTLLIFCALEYRRDYDEEFSFYARAADAGTNLLSLDQIGAQITRARLEGATVFAIAFPHWNGNYGFATEKQIQYSRDLIDRGVDLIVGHGSHMFQDIDFYQGAWIVRGLGNFVFAAPGRYKDESAAPFGAIARAELKVVGGSVVPRIFLYPIFLDNRISNYKTRFVTETEFNQFDAIVAEHSSAEALNKIDRGRDQYGYYLVLD